MSTHPDLLSPLYQVLDSRKLGLLTLDILERLRIRVLHVQQAFQHGPTTRAVDRDGTYNDIRQTHHHGARQEHHHRVLEHG